MQNISRQQADFTALVDAERDFAEMHVLQGLIERDRVPGNGGDGSLLRLREIEVGRGKGDHVPFAPAPGIQYFDPGATGVGCCSEFGPGVRPVTMQVQGSARDHDPAVTHSIQFFIRDIVGEGDGRLALVGFGFGADFQFPVHHDPFGGQLEVGFVREAEFAFDMQAAQRRRTHVEDDVLATFNGDFVACAGHLPVRPGGRIRPARGLDRRLLSRFNDSRYAAEREGRNEQRKKERPKFLSHGIPLSLQDIERQEEDSARVDNSAGPLLPAATG